VGCRGVAFTSNPPNTNLNHHSRAVSSEAEHPADNREAGESRPPRRTMASTMEAQFFASVAQLDEPRPTKPKDGGSNPPRCAVMWL
jgi:hypothetical protein